MFQMIDAEAHNILAAAEQSGAFEPTLAASPRKANPLTELTPEHSPLAAGHWGRTLAVLIAYRPR
jgi:hypothetical protein